MKKPTPVMGEIQKSLKRTATTLDLIAKQQAAWDAHMKVQKAQRDKERIKDEQFLDDLYEIAELNRRPLSTADKFFSSAMENAMPFMIRGISFDEISVDESYFRRRHEMDCDIVLVNQRYIALIEAEDFLELDHVLAFDKNLRDVLPRVLPRPYRHLLLVPGMACMDLSQQAEQKARALGFALLFPQDRQARVEDAYLRVRPSILSGFR